MSPIRPDQRKHYGRAWREISRAIRAECGGRCECRGECGDCTSRCRARNGFQHPITGARVVLTVAHLNHDPTDNRRENLRALCQRCHNRHDAPMRAGHARETRRSRRATGDLFDGASR